MLVAGFFARTGADGRERNLPEISGRLEKLDPGGPFAALGAFHVDDAAILMLAGIAVNDAKNLADRYRSGQYHQAAMGTDALHLSRLAE